jgi:hypothetical protein
MGDDGYPRFSDGELSWRFGLVQELMAGQGVEALPLHGGPSALGPVHHLSGYLPVRPTWMSARYANEPEPPARTCGPASVAFVDWCLVRTTP